MKRMLQIVLLAYAGLALLYPQAHSFLSLLLISIGRGIASSFLWLTSWSFIFTYTEKVVKGKETSFFSDMNDLASALSPIIGGLVTVVSFFLPFYLLSLTSLTAFLIVTIRLKETPTPQRVNLKDQLDRLSRYMRDRRFMKTIALILIFYALINIYYSFLSVFLNSEGISIPLIGVIMTVALLPAVSLEVPMGRLVDSRGVRKTLLLAASLTTISAVLIPLSSDFYYALAVITAFTVSYTMIFIVLYSRMSDVMRQDKVLMTGAIATFKDLGYTIGPLLAGYMIASLSITETFFITGSAFVLLLPIAFTIHD